MDEYNDDLKFVVRQTKDPFSGEPLWGAYYEPQGVEFFCNDEEEAEEVCRLLNERNLLPFVYIDDFEEE